MEIMEFTSTDLREARLSNSFNLSLQESTLAGKKRSIYCD